MNVVEHPEHGLPARAGGRAPRRSPGLGLSEAEQARFFWQRSRMLSRTTLAFALAATLTTLLCLLTPGAMSGPGLALSLGIMAVHVTAHIVLYVRPSTFWVLACFVLGNTLMLSLWNDPGAPANVSIIAAVIAVSAWGLGSIGTVLVSTRGHLVVLGILFLVALAHLWLALGGLGRDFILPLLIMVGSWIVAVAFGIWLHQTFPRIMRRISALGNAYALERRASEAQAERHREARLLHDTVLATLSLLAHQGVGVSDAALRAQAESDRALLARLRSGEQVTPQASGEYVLTTPDHAEPAEAVRALCEKFSRLGLDVSWHGSGEIAEDSAAGQALLGALGECLENVRRHSGVDSAAVTLSATETHSRAIVTDTGSGFDPADTPPGKLGYAESVVGRLRSVGGSARVFSSPGAGTTVILEVPR